MIVIRRDESRREDKKIQNRVAEEEYKSEIELGLRVLRASLLVGFRLRP